MIVYFDTSALVKLVVDENGSEVAGRVWNGAEATLTSRLAYPEAIAALAQARRSGRLTKGAHEVARAAFLRRFATMRIIEVSEEIARVAGRLAESQRLRGSDAIHIASAVALSEVVLATWDHEQHRAAEELGLAVAGV